MVDSIQTPSFTSSGRFRIIIAVVALLIVVTGAWWFSTRGHESTDDAQVDAHVTQIAPRVGGTILKVAVSDNQVVEAGTVLVEIDPRDYQVAVDRAKAELADAEAAAIAAQSNVPITSTSTESGVSAAQTALDQARPDLAPRLQDDPAAYLELVTLARDAHSETGELLRAAVVSARRAGCTWEQVGGVLGMTKQAAQDRKSTRLNSSHT